MPKHEWEDDTKIEFKFIVCRFVPSMIDNLHDIFQAPVTGYNKHDSETSSLRTGHTDQLSNPWHKQGLISVEFVVTRFIVFVVPLL